MIQAEGRTVVVISGKPGTGKSVLSKFLANKYGLERFPVGDNMRRLVREENPGVDFNAQNEDISDSVHLKLDKEMVQFMRNPEGEHRDVDAWMAVYFASKLQYNLANVYKIMVVANWDECMRRIASREGKSVQVADAETKKRMEENYVRWEERLHYGPHERYFDQNNADDVIDNTRMGLEATQDELVRVLISRGFPLERK